MYLRNGFRDCGSSCLGRDRKLQRHNGFSSNKGSTKPISDAQTGGNLASSSEQNFEAFSVRVLVHAETAIQNIPHQGGAFPERLLAST